MRRIALALLVALLTQSPSSAREIGSWTISKSISSGYWSVIAFGANQVPTNSAYAITWVVNTGTAYNFFNLRNNGSHTVSGFIIEVSQAQIGGSGKPNNTTFDLCQNGTWNPSSNTCSGTRVTVGTAVDLSSSILFSGLNLLSGSELSMRASTPPNLKNTYTTTLSVLVTRLQIRAGNITNV